MWSHAADSLTVQDYSINLAPRFCIKAMINRTLHRFPLLRRWRSVYSISRIDQVVLFAHHWFDVASIRHRSVPDEAIGWLIHN